MKTEKRYDEGLEEIWRIKREIAAEYPTLDDYFRGMMAYREERLRSGVKLVRFPPKDESPMPQAESPRSVAEAPAEYDAGAKPDASPSNANRDTP